jgi:hypothetical protein
VLGFTQERGRFAIDHPIAMPPHIEIAKPSELALASA